MVIRTFVDVCMFHSVYVSQCVCNYIIYIYIYIYTISTHTVVRIGFTTNSSVVTSNGETTFTIGILSGQLQFGASVRVTLTAVGPIKGTVYT